MVLFLLGFGGGGGSGGGEISLLYILWMLDIHEAHICTIANLYVQ